MFRVPCVAGLQPALLAHVSTVLFSADVVVLQDSGVDGAGYETAIKGGAIAAAGKPKSRPASKPGTKKVGEEGLS
jgi:hypothetical protein